MRSLAALVTLLVAGGCSGPAQTAASADRPPPPPSAAASAPTVSQTHDTKGWARAASPDATSDLAMRWLRVTGDDPRVVAIRTGVPLDGGDALAATQGLLARVHLATGEIVALGSFPSDPRVGGRCSGGRSHGEVWLACEGASELLDFGRGERHRGLAVFQVDVSAAEPRALAPVIQHLPREEFPVVFSESGGMLLGFACRDDGDNDNESCVRQPDGSWRDVRTVSAARELAPLADGRAAAVRRDTHGWHLTTFDPQGEQKDLPENAFPKSKTRVSSLEPSMVEEGADGTIHFVLSEPGNDNSEIWIGAQPSDGRLGTLTLLRGATKAALHGAYGLAFAREVPFVTVDHGTTWSPLPELPPYLEPAPDGSPPRRETRDVRSVSAVGAEATDLFRLGW